MGLFGKKVELPPPPPPTLVESLKEALKEVDVATHLQWAAVAGLMLLTFYHLCRTGVGYPWYTPSTRRRDAGSRSSRPPRARRPRRPGSAQVDEAAAAAKVEGAEKVDEAAGKLGVDAPPVSMEVIDQAAELTKGKVAEAATTDAVKAAVGPAQ
jgi:hypothetical protein